MNWSYFASGTRTMKCWWLLLMNAASVRSMRPGTGPHRIAGVIDLGV